MVRNSSYRGLLLSLLLSLLLPAGRLGAAISGESRALTEVPAPASQPVMVIIAGLDATLPAYDTPERKAVRFWVTVGEQVVLLHTERRVDGAWALVQLPEDGRTGWVPAGWIRVPSPARATIRYALVCVGVDSHPSERCGAEFAIREGEEVWLRFDVSGLAANDLLQRVLVVNGERYQLPPERWQPSMSTRHLVNLMEHQPRIETGRWTVQFYRNGRLVGEVPFFVHVLSP